MNFLIYIKVRLLLLDLYSDSYPEYQNLESYYGHYFIWNMLQDFGGANGKRQKNNQFLIINE